MTPVGRYAVAPLQQACSRLIDRYLFAQVAALLLIGGGIVLVARRRRSEGQTATADALDTLSVVAINTPPPEPEEVKVARQIQELIERRPEAFENLLRSWLADE